MNRFVAVLVMLGCGVCAWAADSFTFVSTLSAPVASFGEVETKQGVTIEADSVINVGSVASTQGKIVLNGNGASPMNMPKLTMENNTVIGGIEAKNWLVNTLTINTNGSVTVGSLIADNVNVADNLLSKLKATNLWVNNNLTMNAGVVNTELNVLNNNDGYPFHFVGGAGEPTGNASFCSKYFCYSGS